MVIYRLMPSESRGLMYLGVRKSLEEPVYYIIHRYDMERDTDELLPSGLKPLSDIIEDIRTDVITRNVGRFSNGQV